MDALERLVTNAETLLKEGYYDVRGETDRSPSFLDALGAPTRTSDVVAELKFASPSMRSQKDASQFDAILEGIVAAKPLGLSVVAEPRIFGGNIDFVSRAARTGLPVLMKDIVVDSRQIDAAALCGASALLLIETLALRGHFHRRMPVLIDEAHDRKVGVLLEVHTLEEWDAAVETSADILGINNRNLATMAIDLGTTPRILAERVKDRPVIAMSGIETRGQVDTMIRAGADAVLVGTSIMHHDEPARKLQELQHG